MAAAQVSFKGLFLCTHKMKKEGEVGEGEEEEEEKEGRRRRRRRERQRGRRADEKKLEKGLGEKITYFCRCPSIAVFEAAMERLHMVLYMQSLSMREREKESLVKNSKP